MPTPEQLASRQMLQDFLEKAKPLRKLAKVIKSEWFGRPDAELKGWIERGRAIAEIKDSMGYRLILSQTDKEIQWAQGRLEICDKEQVMEFQMYLRCLRFFQDFILTTERNADIAGSVLEGRSTEIGRESEAFVRNARVEGN